MPRYMWFIIATLALITGYCFYGRFVERVFGPDPNRPTPAVSKADAALTSSACRSGSSGLFSC